jgi:hypothetical protein
MLLYYRDVAEKFGNIFYLGDKFKNLNDDAPWYSYFFYGQSSFYFGIASIIWSKNLILTFAGFR